MSYNHNMMKNVLNHRKVIFLVLFFGLSVFLIWLFNTDQTEISLGQAYKLAYENIYEDNSYIMLSYLTSVDIEGDVYSNDGNNGKRKHWNLDFAVPNTNIHYIVEIRNGDVVNKQEVMGLKYENSELISENEMRFDSDDIFNEATKLYDIVPGKIWAIGYHYTLSKENEHSFQTLVCYDTNGSLCNIVMDISSGEIVSSMCKTMEGGGIFDEYGNMIADKKYQINRLIELPEQRMIAAAGYTYINEIEYLPLILIIADNGIKEFQVTDDVYDLEYIGNKLYVISSKGINKFDFDTGKEEILYESEIIAWGEENNIFAVADKENIVSVDKQGEITVYNYADCGASELKTLDINGDEIFFGNEKSIYRLFKGSIEEILNYDEEIIRDIECYRNNLYIITNNAIKIVDVKKCTEIMSLVNEYDMDSFLANDSRGQYMISASNEIVVYIREGEEEQKIQEIPNCGIVTDLCHTSTDRKIYSYFSKFVWHDMPERR